MQKHIPLIALLILASAITLKANRYLNATPPERSHSTAHELSNFLAHHGWAINHNIQKQKRTLLSQLTYAKENCATHLTVALLTDNTELHAYLKSIIGSDFLILENGRFSHNQKSVQLNWTPPTKIAASYFGQSTSTPLPPLAISPAPSSSSQRCAPPARKHWLTWSKTG